MVRETGPPKAPEAQDTETVEVRRRTGRTARQSTELVLNGRKAYVQLLDNILADPTVLNHLEHEMREQIKMDAVGFVREMVHPLLPKQLTVGAAAGKAQLQILFEETTDG